MIKGATCELFIGGEKIDLGPGSGFVSLALDEVYDRVLERAEENHKIVVELTATCDRAQSQRFFDVLERQAWPHGAYWWRRLMYLRRKGLTWRSRWWPCVARFMERCAIVNQPQESVDVSP